MFFYSKIIIIGHKSINVSQEIITTTARPPFNPECLLKYGNKLPFIVQSK